MKVAINTCYGGFSLSPLAVYEIAKRKGKDCFFFKFDFKSDKKIPLPMAEAEKELLVLSYSVPNPMDYKLDERDSDGLYRSANERSAKIVLDFTEDRKDPDLVAVIDELGEKADTRFSKLKIVDIPDGTEYEIEEYDGREWVSEKHKTWS